MAPSTQVIVKILSVFEKTGAVAKIPTKTKELSKKRLDTANVVKNLLIEDSSISIRKMA